MMARITGSALDRIVRCEASAALPQVVDANEDDEHTKDKDKGSARHKFLERVVIVGRDAALAEVDTKHRATCEDIELAKLGNRLKLSTEVAFAYNYANDTGRILTPVAPRVYDIDSTCEIAGTIDLAGVSDDSVAIGDYKGAHGWLPKPGASYQLGLAALALARIYDKSSARVEYVRLLDDGDSISFNATLDAFALEGVADSIKLAMGRIPALRGRRIAGEILDVVEGGFCRYCPARTSCPAKVAMVRAVLHEPPAPLNEQITPENAGRFYMLIRRAEDALKIAKGALFAYAKVTPIPIETNADGSVRYFGELTRDGNDVLDGSITHQVVSARYGGEAANRVVTMEATKSALTDTIRPLLKPGEKITLVIKDVLAAIDAAGGVSNKPTTTTTEFLVGADGPKAKRRKAMPPAPAPVATESIPATKPAAVAAATTATPPPTLTIARAEDEESDEIPNNLEERKCATCDAVLDVPRELPQGQQCYACKSR